MFVYSSAIIAFTKKLHKKALKILADECGLKVRSKRFELDNYLYPLSLHVFDGQKKLGYFDPQFSYIGIHKSLMTCPDDRIIENLLRHELAHYLCWIKFANTIEPHGKEFRELCKTYGWGKEVYAAQENFDSQYAQDKGLIENQKIVQKIQKLFNLAKNPTNPHEAQVATAKANQLLLKYHLKDLPVESAEDEEVYRQQVLSFKRRSGKTDAILAILNHFYVQAIYSSGHGLSCIEVIGDKASVELSDYLAKFLDQELELMLKKSRQEAPSRLKGLRARNAFFQGLAKGYTQQIKRTQQAQQVSSRELVAINQKLERQSQLVYQGRLSRIQSSQKGDRYAENRGAALGAKLNIRKGLGMDRVQKLLGF